jgi:hypothetical protein
LLLSQFFNDLQGTDITDLRLEGAWPDTLSQHDFIDPFWLSCWKGFFDWRIKIRREAIWKYLNLNNICSKKNDGIVQAAIRCTKVCTLCLMTGAFTQI